jgi:hypothetical protein
MNHALKGVLLSALVLPGLGQYVLRRRRRGAVLIGIVLMALLVIVVQATRIALGILTRLEAGGTAPDMPAITAAAQDAVQGSGAASIQAMLLLIVACWLFAIVDAYRIGHALDREARRQQG